MLQDQSNEQSEIPRPENVFKVAFNLYKLERQGKINDTRKYLTMEKIDVLKHLVRLSTIAEAIEDTDPESAGLIDDTISDVAGQYNSRPEIDPNMFPPLETPRGRAPAFDPADEHQDVDALAHQIVDSITHSQELNQLLPSLHGEHGTELLNSLVEKKVKEALESGR